MFWTKDRGLRILGAQRAMCFLQHLFAKESPHSVRNYNFWMLFESNLRSSAYTGLTRKAASCCAFSPCLGDLQPSVGTQNPLTRASPLETTQKTIHPERPSCCTFSPFLEGSGDIFMHFRTTLRSSVHERPPRVSVQHPSETAFLLRLFPLLGDSYAGIDHFGVKPGAIWHRECDHLSGHPFSTFSFKNEMVCTFSLKNWWSTGPTG